MQKISTKLGMRLVTVGIVLVSVASYFLASITPEATKDPAFSFSFAVGVLASLFYIFGAIYFLAGLKRFRLELRKAYILLSFGFIALGISMVQLPIITLLDAQWWINSGFVVLPYLLSVSLTFAGVKKLTRLLKDESVVASWVVVGLTALTAALVFSSFPFADETIPEMERRFAVMLTSVTVTFYFFSAAGTEHVRRLLSRTYTYAMRWLYFALLASGFAAAHYILVLLFSPSNEHWYIRYSLVTVGLVFSGYITMRSGYAFNWVSNKRTYRTDKKNVRKRSTNTNPEHILVDVVSFVASLASNPTEIDSLLMKFREVTSRLGPGEEMKETDKDVLLDTYEEIVEYLIHNEQLRAYTRESIEADLRDLFKDRLQILMRGPKPVLKKTHV